MRRSGKLLVILLSAAALSACTAVPSEPTAEPPSEISCPAGLADALEEFLLERPLGDRMPVETVVTEFPEMSFASDVIPPLVGCVMLLESRYEGGDRMMQMFGLADGLDEAGVIAELEAAGWVQHYSYVWGTEDLSESAGIFTLDSPAPEFGFDRWAEFLEPDDVVISSAVAF